jgi:outer membrane protein assembly factor BamA
VKANVVAIAATILSLFLFAVAPAGAKAERSPQVAIVERGAKIAAVSIETYGVVKTEEVQRYLSLRQGDMLEQSAVDRDYNNLTRLAGWRARLMVERDPLPARFISTGS